MNNYTLHVTYDKDIRSIDLENILSGIRLLCEHELSKRTGVNIRNYADCVRIKGIEKGSIVINLFIDININIDLIQLIEKSILIYLCKKQVNSVLESAIKGIITALRRGNRIFIKKDKKSTEINVPDNFDGEIILDKDNNLRLKSNPNKQ